MTTNQAYRCEPDFLIAPGETLLETIETMNITQAELAKRMGRPLKTINGIIKGNTAITPETALQLERVLGIPYGFWMNLENNYRETLKKEQEKLKLQESVKWLKNFPLKQMIKMGWIEKKDTEVGQIEELLRFFKVASIKAWDDIWQTNVAFRKSPAFKANPYAISAWLRKGEIIASELNCSPFNKEKFKSSLEKIRSLTLATNPEIFIPELTKICSNCGVAVVFLPELDGCRASGATKWLNNNTPMILLSVRHKTNDHLWFTFFHEAGHILYHGKKMTFVEGLKGIDNQKKEEEANTFSADFLIPKREYSQLIETKPSKAEVISFSKRIGIAPGIVVGRLQKDHKIPYSYYNDLKIRYIWNNK
ncbi:HigA family addiction module antitoxin [Heyndrickxia faecalis]|uniref:HigA family addiction module antitoxin n=1 Tax=Heyndrickxia TaxID=2837504 RepID=UPI002E1AA956|nr:HigA family addiction module antitoxin [Weizmannia sp. CD-2023]MED4977242.1 HigA family addiction module antitoxin [Weizmannia sp. CD-2023]